MIRYGDEDKRKDVDIPCSVDMVSDAQAVSGETLAPLEGMRPWRHYQPYIEVTTTVQSVFVCICKSEEESKKSW